MILYSTEAVFYAIQPPNPPHVRRTYRSIHDVLELQHISLSLSGSGGVLLSFFQVSHQKSLATRRTSSSLSLATAARRLFLKTVTANAQTEAERFPPLSCERKIWCLWSTEERKKRGEKCRPHFVKVWCKPSAYTVWNQRERERSGNGDNMMSCWHLLRSTKTSERRYKEKCILLLMWVFQSKWKNQ